MNDIEKTIRLISTNPGVYIYKNSQQTVIYVGKAINLSKRVKQYFQREDALGEKTSRLVSEIATIDTIETEHEFDALLLEAKLIKYYQPKFNVIAKDDKSPLYIAISIKQTLPTVFFARKPKHTTTEQSQTSTNVYFGPFQSSKAARSLLRSLRKVVPYCTQKQRTGKKCFYTHLGLCNPCPSYISKLSDTTEKKELTKKFRHNIFRLRDILSGTAVSVIVDMEKEMKLLSDSEHYEEALAVRNQLSALKSILTKRYDPILYFQSDTMLKEIFDSEQKELEHVLTPYYPTMRPLRRIECFDISNTMGTNATASMVVVTNGRIDKDQYRKFRIRRKDVPNDFAMMAEVLTRRFKHEEWNIPDLVVIDGGKGQVSAAKKALSTFDHIFSDIPIIGLAKKHEEIIVPYKDQWKVIRLPYSNEGLKLLQRIRDEAHRFAITYHKLLRSKDFVTIVGGARP